MISFIRKILTAIFGPKTGGGMMSGYIAGNSIRLFLMQIIALALGFVSNFIIIRIAGVAAYGEYVYIFNFLYLAGVVSLAGTDTLLIRKIPVYREPADQPRLKGLLRFSFFVAALVAIVLSLPAAGALFYSNGGARGSFSNLSLISAISLLLLAITAVSQASLQGMKKPVWSQITEKILRPALGILLVAVYAVFSGKPRSQQLIWLNIVTLLLAMGTSLYLLSRANRSAGSQLKPSMEVREWVRMLPAFFIIDILYILNARIDVFLLGIFRSNTEVAVYNIALRVSEMTGLGLVIVNFVLAPLVAALYANRDVAGLQRAITRSARAVWAISLPFAAVALLFRHEILAFFNADMVAGSDALIILCAGQVVNVICGSVGLLLLMTGHQRYSLLSLACGTAVSVTLNLLLVPRWGLMGTAFATTAGMVTWNFLMYYFVRKKTGINTLALRVL